MIFSTLVPLIELTKIVIDFFYPVPIAPCTFFLNIFLYQNN